MTDHEDGKLYRYDAASRTFDPVPDDDCYARALPGEPRFTLLGRDPEFYSLVLEWATRRGRDINCGERPMTDSSQVAVALATATNGANWRRENLGKWRNET